eukprot:Blabericola_migrator_1__5587@NODE_2842_length_2295_cov_82_603232_g1782_i0_p1_GENE_NODE_2842_length_2295_cov_82_603232_g1782_i0NODE_2842_length_2295_cov_82_603232_g1782_i0_p1_ORF_typecomplete_len443_score69_44PRKCSHlike/PF12999_7/6_6e20PRKCSHlike/PF12999_7/1_5e03PRKCSH_1/PF13015_6/1_5e07_NODE_2842_length_2295_cov_82_603232_g1782_i0891417
MHNLFWIYEASIQHNPPSSRAATLAHYEMFVDATVQQQRIPCMYSDHTFSTVIGDREAQMALPNPGFYCPQQGFYPNLIPSWRVNDNICDCCDGSDETPSSACPHVCDKQMKSYQERQAWEKAEEDELIALGLARYEEGLRMMREWQDLVETGPLRIENLTREIEEMKVVKSEETTESTSSSEVAFEEAIFTDGSEDDGDEWVEEWNEDGSVKRVKKEVTSKRLLQAEKGRNLLSRLRRLEMKIRNALKSVVTFRKRIPDVEPPPKRQPSSHRSYNDPVQVKTRELKALQADIDKAESNAANPLYKAYPQITPWMSKTLTWRIGETTYTVPILGSPSSRQNWDNRIALGTFVEVVDLDKYADWPKATIGRGSFAPWGLLYEGGSPCGLNRKETITSLLYLVCAKDDEVLVWEEQSECHWTGALATPAGCHTPNATPPSHDEL